MRFIKLKSWSHRQRWTRWASRLVSSFDSWGCVVVVHVSKTNHGQSLVTALCSDSACQQNKTKLRGSTRNAGRINPWFPNKSRGKPVQQRRTGLLLGGRGNGLGRHGQNPPPPSRTHKRTLSVTHTHTNTGCTTCRSLIFDGWGSGSEQVNMACVYNRRCRGSRTCDGLSRRKGAATQEKPGYSFFDRLSLRIPPRSIWGYQESVKWNKSTIEYKQGVTVQFAGQLQP